MRLKQFGAALMLVFPIKAALGFVFQIEPHPLPVAINAAAFAVGLIIFLRTKDDSTN